MPTERIPGKPSTRRYTPTERERAVSLVRQLRKELVEIAKGANRRLLELQSVGQGCAIETALWERISQSSREEGQRTGALRFGDQRAMALAGALCVALNTVVGFTYKSPPCLGVPAARRLLQPTR
jgi:hypothetical protein